MSVLTNVEAKSWKGITFRTFVFIALIIGGTTMVYPFLIMLSGSMKSEMDSAQMDMVPAYFSDDHVLARKFLESKYNHDVATMNMMRGYPDFGFWKATIPAEVNVRQATDLLTFAEESDIPDHWWILGGTLLYQRVASANLSRFIDRLRQRYDDDLAKLGEDLGAPMPKWMHVSMRPPEWVNPRYGYVPSPFFEEYFQLLHDRPFAERSFVSSTGWFMQNIVYPKYGRDTTDAYNANHTRSIANFHDLVLPRTVPGEDEPMLREEWILFVREMLNDSYIRTTLPDERYQQFLAGRYDTIEQLNERWSTDYASFADIREPGDRQWVTSAQRQDFGVYLEPLEPELLYLVGPEFAWHDWLKQTYGSVAALNAAHGTSYQRWADAVVPTDHAEYHYVVNNSHALRWEYATLNFSNVFTEVILQGRPFINTIIYVCLSMVLCLTLQPLAAYALSRFSPPGTWRFILIFMATMAFPPMVGLIPQFLILRKLHLLNTFIALVLPVVVNGYLVFLLKGFFDSLPQHLYDAALIDGASELRMFWEITMSLSKPILAIVALQTFNIAWISFMYPLLVCPKEEMHVLAVWLYDFQQQAPTSTVFASILITSIPTLLIFLFTQRTIMRGIAVPVEK
jgi:multiple sugar transport system permease protein